MVDQQTAVVDIDLRGRNMGSERVCSCDGVELDENCDYPHGLE